MKEEEINSIRQGAFLHDIGESLIPDEILHKKSGLNKDELLIIRQHPENAKKILSEVNQFNNIMDIPFHHHERWDGSGYPQGLKELEIPLAARIFAVVDVWDMLNRDRPYRNAWPREEARAYLNEQSGVLFDPQIVKLLFKMIKDID